jgi:hypothetical protein
VAREVELYRILHPERPILAALVEGEPDSSFPEALRGDASASGPTEPLAADFRTQGDGPRLALLKLVAGIAQVELDELVQRDAQRRVRSVTAVTAATLVLALVMTALAGFAFQQRRAAEAQRAQAEGLVEFMLTDLRDRLEGVGRLDVLTDVNRRALAHYAGQDVSRLPAESLERRARILHLIGEDSIELGDLDWAAREFADAHRSTAALLAEDPTNPRRIFYHAQSEYWVARLAFHRGDRLAAKRGFDAYRRLAGDLVASDRDDPAYLREMGFAEGNLCTLAMEEPGGFETALNACSVSLRWMQRAVEHPRAPPAYALDLAHRHAWLADVYRLQNQLEPARRHRDAEGAILARAIAADPTNLALRARTVALDQAIAGIEFRAGRPAAARRRLVQARNTLKDLLLVEPANQNWSMRKRAIDGYIQQVDRGA